MDSFLTDFTDYTDAYKGAFDSFLMATYRFIKNSRRFCRWRRFLKKIIATNARMILFTDKAYVPMWLKKIQRYIGF